MLHEEDTFTLHLFHQGSRLPFSRRLSHIFSQGADSLLNKILSPRGPDSFLETDPCLGFQGLDSLLGTRFPLKSRLPPRRPWLRGHKFVLKLPTFPLEVLTPPRGALSPGGPDSPLEVDPTFVSEVLTPSLGYVCRRGPDSLLEASLSLRSQLPPQGAFVYGS